MQSQEVAAKLRSLPIIDIVDRAMRKGINEGVAIVSDRVFEENTDIKGGGFGAYSESWKKAREAKGRQVARVDLQFNKDLLRSITDDVSSDRYSVKIKEDLNVKKARGFEKNRGIEVFFASEEERKNIIDVIEKEFIKQIEGEF